MAEKHSVKSLAINITLSFAVILICFLLLEVIFRSTEIGKIEESKASFIRHTGYSPFLIFGPNLNKKFKQKDGQIAYWNSQGFRLKEDLPLKKKRGEYRIFALGGSTTEDLANGENLHYCGETNKILSSYKNVNCVNAGMSAYSTAQSTIRLQFDLLQFNPDMITVMHNINDLHVNFFPYHDERSNYANKFLYKDYAPGLSLKYSFLRESRAMIYLYQSFVNIKNRVSGEKIKAKGKGVVLSTMRYSSEPIALRSKNSFRNNLMAIAAIGKAHNIAVVLMTQPAVFSDDKIALQFGVNVSNDYILYPRKEEFFKLFKEYNRIIEEVARQQNVYFIDMYNLFGNDEKYFKDMVHYNASGVRRFARIYSENIKKTMESQSVKNVKE